VGLNRTVSAARCPIFAADFSSDPRGALPQRALESL
jgi:hypothetical protein